MQYAQREHPAGRHRPLLADRLPNAVFEQRLGVVMSPYIASSRLSSTIDKDPSIELMSVEQAYKALLRHQPASNGFSYEPHCAICSGLVPCSSRKDAEAALAEHGHDPSPTQAQVEAALNIQFLG